MKMFKVMYQRFGFSKVITADPTAQNVFLAYCEGKNFLWNIYLGWRETLKDDSMIFWLPTKKISALQANIESIYRYAVPKELIEIL